MPRDRFLTLEGVRFHYLDWGGDGEPLLMLAGLGCTAHVFAELAPHLTDRYRVLALTRRGHGLTEQVGSGHALEDAAEDARRLLDALDIGRAHLVGHSMGAGEVSALAARHPERVASVVFLDGAFDWADSPSPEGADEGPDHFASYDDFVTYVRTVSPDFDENWGTAFDAMFPTLVDSHADGSVTYKLVGDEAAAFVKAVMSYRHPWGDIAAPALAIYAVGDRWQGAAAAWRAASRERFAAEVADGRVLEIHDAGHYLFLDHRDDVLAAMREFPPGSA